MAVYCCSVLAEGPSCTGESLFWDRDRPKSLWEQSWMMDDLWDDPKEPPERGPVHCHSQFLGDCRQGLPSTLDVDSVPRTVLEI